ncbi:MAG: hypothetical protein HUJ54_00425 [Erysipelotrichaceae bacterium]|nr:hypothetical protein [Erysipelotrichaceae bacterium]
MMKIKNWLALLAAVCLLFAGCSRLEGKTTVNIAVDDESQSMLMTEMLVQLLEQKGIETELTEVKEGTKSIQPALEAGLFDLYFEDTGKAWSYVLKEPESYRQSDFDTLMQKYERMDLAWKGLQKFQLKKTLAVKKDTAQKLNLKTLSDLRKYKGDLILGIEKEFLESEEGYPLLKTEYSLDGLKTVILTNQLLYPDLSEGICTVIPVDLSDGHLSDGKITALEDNMNVLPECRIGYVVRQNALQKVPVLEEVLDSLEGLMTLPDLQRLNSLITSGQKTPKEAAALFLEEKGLLGEQKSVK